MVETQDSAFYFAHNVERVEDHEFKITECQRFRFTMEILGALPSTVTLTLCHAIPGSSPPPASKSGLIIRRTLARHLHGVVNRVHLDVKVNAFKVVFSISSDC